MCNEVEGDYCLPALDVPYVAPPLRDQLERFEMRDAYARSFAMAGAVDRLVVDRALLGRLVPDSWLLAITAIMDEGPEVARRRAQAAVNAYCRKPVDGNKRRGKGGKARTTGTNFVRDGNSILQTLSAVAWDGQVVAKLVPPPMEKRGYKVVAPPVRDVRRALGETNAAIRVKLRCGDSYAAEVEALTNMSPKQVVRSGVAPLLRNRAVIAMALTCGGRSSAIGDIVDRDYIRKHIGPAPDHREGPAIRLTPGKDNGLYDSYVRSVPPAVGLILDAWLLCRARHLEYHGRPAITPDSPLLLGVAGSAATPTTVGRLNLYINPSGKTAKPFVKRRPEHCGKDVDPRLAATAGYSIHEYRHLASQQAERGGAMWEERYTSNELGVMSPSSYASALLLNGGDRDKIRARYGGHLLEERIELLAGRAAAMIWEIIDSDAGLRRRPDLDSYRAQLQQLKRLENEERRLQEESRRLQRRGASVSPDEGGDRVDLLLRELRELKSITLAGFSITNDLQIVHQAKMDTMVKLDLLRLDQRTWLYVPDDEPDGAEFVDWKKIDDEALGKELMPGVAEGPTKVRGFFLVGELCELADVVRSTLTRWLKGEHLPSTGKRPWEPDAIPVDSSLGPNYRRIWVDEMHESFFGHRMMREKRDEILSAWPTGQGWMNKDGTLTDRCHAPKKLDGVVRKNS